MMQAHVFWVKLGIGCLAVILLWGNVGPSVAQGAPSGLSGMIAYVSDRNGQTDVYVQDLVNGRVWQITNDAAAESWPIITPNGKQVIFAAEVDGVPDLFAVNLDGFVLSNLTNSPDIIETEPAISPDGARVAYVRRFVDTPESSQIVERYLNAPSTNIEVYTASEDTFRSPRYSPDGTQLVYAGTESTQITFFVRTVDFDSSRTVVQSRVAQYVNPRWSQDGTRIIAIELTPGLSTGRIVAIVPASGAVSLITTNPTLPYRSAIALPKGAGYIATLQMRESAPIVIQWLDAAGTFVADIATAGELNAMPSWSPARLPDVPQPPLPTT